MNGAASPLRVVFRIKRTMQMAEMTPKTYIE